MPQLASGPFSRLQKEKFSNGKIFRQMQSGDMGALKEISVKTFMRTQSLERDFLPDVVLHYLMKCSQI